MITLMWADAKGGGNMRTFATSAKCWKFMCRLCCEATARKDGVVVGVVERRDYVCDDDKRRKWFRCIEND